MTNSSRPSTNYSTMKPQLHSSNFSATSSHNHLAPPPLLDDGDSEVISPEEKCAAPQGHLPVTVCPPPSFNSSGTTRPYYLFPLFVLLNIATMADRAIIPGASKEFSAFLSSANDAPPVVQENPDAGLGILQAGFIGGYSVAIVLSSHYVHKIRWKTLVLVGLSIWWLAVLGSGTALTLNSYYFLLVSRMASGVSEAAFHVVAPPLIQDRSGRHAGLWLSIYLCGMPVGLALGYIYGSFMAGHERWGWNWAYYWECILSLPLLLVMGFVKDNINGGILTGAGEYEVDPIHRTNGRSLRSDSGIEVDSLETSSVAMTEEDTQQPLLPSSPHDNLTPPQPISSYAQRRPKKKKFTIWSEIKTCFSSRVLVTLSLGYAAMIAVVSSLGTFGGAFVLALQLFEDERTAAVCFGSAAALSGVVGMPLGGRLVDGVLSRSSKNESSATTLLLDKKQQVGSLSPGGISGDEMDDSMRHLIVSRIMPRINILVFGSLLFIFPTLAMQEAVFFLTFLSIGWILLFATQTGIMLCAMLAVDTGHRPNALAFITLISHLFGDVPAPIVLGLIKDQLAPNCRVGKDGEFVDPDQCSKEDQGVRLSLAIAYSWTLWSLILFELARRFAAGEKQQDDYDRLNAHLATRDKEANSLIACEEEHIGKKVDLFYYHSKFKPPTNLEADDSLVL